jgi:serine/threonine protein kinase HipA of HipAB toxin-antitoxin module
MSPVYDVLQTGLHDGQTPGLVMLQSNLRQRLDMTGDMTRKQTSHFARLLLTWGVYMN